MAIICTMDGVRGGEGDVHLGRDEETGRYFVLGTNEGGFASVDIDLLDLLAWLIKADGEGTLAIELAAALQELNAPAVQMALARLTTECERLGQMLDAERRMTLELQARLAAKEGGA